tara:strand:- start:18 stop:236 length:219 start_codon:yes stop_codon:yes gene_type:complete
MMIKLKGICVDINKSKSLDKLKQLKIVCHEELKECDKAKKGFIKFILRLLDDKLKELAHREVLKKTININSY